MNGWEIAGVAVLALLASLTVWRFAAGFGRGFAESFAEQWRAGKAAGKAGNVTSLVPEPRRAPGQESVTQGGSQPAADLENDPGQI